MPVTLQTLETLKIYVSRQVNFFRERYSSEIGSLYENVLNLTKLQKEKKRKELYNIDETRRRENLYRNQAGKHGITIFPCVFLNYLQIVSRKM